MRNGIEFKTVYHIAFDHRHYVTTSFLENLMFCVWLTKQGITFKEYESLSTGNTIKNIESI